MTRYFFLAAILSLGIGCQQNSTDFDTGFTEEEPQSGLIAMPLTTVANGEMYRLSAAALSFTSDDHVTSVNLSDTYQLSISLEEGEWGVELEPGWFIERIDGEDFQALEGQLISINPQYVEVERGHSTSISYGIMLEDDLELLFADPNESVK